MRLHGIHAAQRAGTLELEHLAAAGDAPSLRALPASDRMPPLARTALLVGVGVAGASYLAPAFLKSRSYMSPIGINRDCTHTMEILLFMLNT